MSTATLVLLAWVACVQVVQIVLKLRISRRQGKYLRDAVAILEVTKAYNEMAHTQHRDAKRVLAKVERVPEEVEKVPEKTATAVVDAIKQDGASGVLDRGS